jgi:hypothetical protein
MASSKWEVASPDEASLVGMPTASVDMGNTGLRAFDNYHLFKIQQAGR